jgi:RHS repeat-associated protein
VVDYHYEASATGRLTSISRRVPGLPDALVTAMGYDASRVTDIEYPPTAEGERFAVHYDFDGHGHVKSVSDLDGTTLWELAEVDQGIRPKVERYGNGVETRYEYYPEATDDSVTCGAAGNNACSAGLVKAITETTGEELLHRTTYSYDRLMNVQRRKTESTAELGSTDVEDFTYDLQRLSTETRTLTTGGETTREFTSYDYGVSAADLHYVEKRETADGPLLHRDVYDYGETGVQLQEFNGKWLYYEPNGAIGQRTTDSGHLERFAYNDLQLPFYTEVDSRITWFDYDASGERAAKRGPSTTTVYAGELYECGGPSGDVDDPVICTENQYKVFAGGRLVAQVTRGDQGQSVGYVHADALGSSTLVTIGTPGHASVVEERRYDPFGRSEINFSSSAQHSGFTGQEHDPETGLINMRGRQYDPELRRFTSADPLVSQPLSPKGWNRYAYVGNNPLNVTDPSGFEGSCGQGCWDFGAPVSSPAPASGGDRAHGNEYPPGYGGPSGTNPSYEIPRGALPEQAGNPDYEPGGSTASGGAPGAPAVEGPGGSMTLQGPDQTGGGAEGAGSWSAGAQGATSSSGGSSSSDLHELADWLNDHFGWGSTVASVVPWAPFGTDFWSGAVDAVGTLLDDNAGPGAQALAVVVIGIDIASLGEAAELGRGVQALGEALDVVQEVRSGWRGGAEAVRKGQAGEAAVRAKVDIGPKTAIEVNGRARIVDGLTDTTVTEVKNVKYQGWTKQLQDSSDFAKETGRNFTLRVAPEARLSGPLLDAEYEEKVIILKIEF